MDEETRVRVQRTRRVVSPWSDDPARGITAARLTELLDRWAHGYDWDVHRHRIETYPWVSTGASGTELRMIHRLAADPHAPVVVLLHGWPDSVLRFERVLPLLDGLHVVVPALPGFPFAAPLAAPGVSAGHMADMIAAALDELGYSRYTVSGGDVGGTVAEILAGRRPDRVAALHLTNVAPLRALGADRASATPDTIAYLDRSAAWFRSEGGYIAEQSTRPTTLAVALGDSPAGLAAWIAEKLEAWSDGSDGPAFTVDELLTWITAYWATGTIGTSFATYVEPAELPARIAAPAVFSAFPHDLKPEPRAYVETFLPTCDYRRHDAGGHFAAWERPAAYVADLRRAVAMSGAAV